MNHHIIILAKAWDKIITDSTSDNKCETKNAHKRPDRVLIEHQIFCETDTEPLQEIIGNAHMDLAPNNGHKFSN